MTDNNSNHQNIGKSSLDQALEKLNFSASPDSHAEREVFASDHRQLRLPIKASLFKDLAWYWRIIRNWVFFLSGLEILVYFLALFERLAVIMLELVDPLLIIVDFVVFGYLTVKIKRQLQESWWQALVTDFLAGFGLGLIMAVFKAFWIREFWTIFNLITEPVFMGLIAVTVALIVGIFVKRKRI
jgi:hypothetical protein